MRKLRWLAVLLALFSAAGCEKTKPASKAHEHKDGDGHEHTDGDAHKGEKK